MIKFNKNIIQKIKMNKLINLLIKNNFKTKFKKVYKKMKKACMKLIVIFINKSMNLKKCKNIKLRDFGIIDQKQLNYS